ncbi:MAG: hypothetical protein GEV12_17485 [Micromonosporaceae bacterium]|nr:hypothetical protein [Micromonosporaceae bacterium]
MVDELAVAGVLFAAVALISCLSVADRRVIRRMPRPAWVTVILLVPLAGPIAWFLAGRPHTTGVRRSAWRVALGVPEPPRPRAPEDDPDFLRSIDPPSAGGHADPQPQPDEDVTRPEDEQRGSESGSEG